MCVCVCVCVCVFVCVCVCGVGVYFPPWQTSCFIPDRKTSTDILYHNNETTKNKHKIVTFATKCSKECSDRQDIIKIKRQKNGRTNDRKIQQQKTFSSPHRHLSATLIYIHLHVTSVIWLFFCFHFIRLIPVLHVCRVKVLTLPLPPLHLWL